MLAVQRSSTALRVTGLIFALMGAALGAGGVWLLRLDGSPYYVAAGVGYLFSGVLLLNRRAASQWVYTVLIIGTLIWAVSESGFDF